MVVYLNEDFQIKDTKGDVLFALSNGSAIYPIKWRYLASHAFTDLSAYQIDFIKHECFVIYVRGKYIGIEKSKCEIPKTSSNGWDYNDYGDY